MLSTAGTSVCRGLTLKYVWDRWRCMVYRKGRFTVNLVLACHWVFIAYKVVRWICFVYCSSHGAGLSMITACSGTVQVLPALWLACSILPTLWLASLSSSSTVIGLFMFSHAVIRLFKFSHVVIGLFRFCVWRWNGWARKTCCRRFAIVCRVNRVTTVTYETDWSSSSKLEHHCMSMTMSSISWPMSYPHRLSSAAGIKVYLGNA